MTFPGIIPAVITPFDAQDRVDVGALEANVAHLVERPGAVGFTGDALRLAPNEVVVVAMGVSNGEGAVAGPHAARKASRRIDRFIVIVTRVSRTA